MAKQNRVVVVRPIYKDDEWIIRVFVDGYESLSRRYYTDDDVDAACTYSAMLEAAEKESETNG